MAYKIDLTGQQFGLWTVLRAAQPTDEGFLPRRFQWLCRCDCGVERLVAGGSLRNGTSRSCGAQVHRPDCTVYLHMAQERRAEPPELHPCRYHPEGVTCSMTRCDGCGWHPVIEAARKALLHPTPAKRTRGRRKKHGTAPS